MSPILSAAAAPRALAQSADFALTETGPAQALALLMLALAAVALRART